MNDLENLTKTIEKASDKKKAIFLNHYFKTGKGGYGEGDIFLGITVFQQRKIAQRYLHLNFSDLRRLLNSKFHEYRLTGLFILVRQYEKADKKRREKIYQFYLKNLNSVNNWDLVDSSASYIIGCHLEKKEKSILEKLAKSKNLWKRRIAIIATYYSIKKGDLSSMFKIGKILLKDHQDLIHKAVGWMLREVGKRDEEREDQFLKKYYQIMPRTMLRYAIEKFSPSKRDFYLQK